MSTKTDSLTADQIISNILNSKGQFVKAVWKSEPTPAAAHKKAGVLLEKKTSAVCRAGINFSQLSAVKMGVESGERDVVGELPFGEWLHFPYVIKHVPKGSEEEVLYIRLYPSDTKSNTLYYVNDEVVDKKTFASYLTPSESKKLLEGEKPLCFTVKRENIIGVDDFEG
jgi:hypothetical protein